MNLKEAADDKSNRPGVGNGTVYETRFGGHLQLQSVSGQYVFAWKPYCPTLSAMVTAMYVASYII